MNLFEFLWLYLCIIFISDAHLRNIESQQIRCQVCESFIFRNNLEEMETERTPLSRLKEPEFFPECWKSILTGKLHL